MVSIGRDIATFGKIREKHLELATWIWIYFRFLHAQIKLERINQKYESIFSRNNSATQKEIAGRSSIQMSQSPGMDSNWKTNRTHERMFMRRRDLTFPWILDRRTISLGRSSIISKWPELHLGECWAESMFKMSTIEDNTISLEFRRIVDQIA
jgi:uncharacterized membrane protein